MLKHSSLLTSPAREAECQILHELLVLEKLRGRNLFLTTLPSAAWVPVELGDVLPGELGRRWGRALLVAAAGPCLAAEGVRAVLWAGGPGSPCGHQGLCDSSACQGTDHQGGDGDSAPLTVLCFHSLQVLHLSPGLFTPEDLMGTYIVLVLFIALLS